MKSRISIDVDYDNSPIILIEFVDSEDVRDKLVKRFIDKFADTSTYARFGADWSSGRIGTTRSTIRPVASYEIPEVVPALLTAAKNELKSRQHLDKETLKHKGMFSDFEEMISHGDEQPTSKI